MTQKWAALAFAAAAVADSNKMAEIRTARQPIALASAF